MARDLNRRVLFDTVAELYNDFRPGYPEQMLADIQEITGINAESNLLEIGAGPGQATKLFATLGCAILSIELGENLAVLARKNVQQYPKVKIVTANFEDYELEPDCYDLVLSGSAFHWIPPEIGFPKCHEALKSDGYLALFWNGDPKPEGDLYEAIQDVYDRVTPEMSERKKPQETEPMKTRHEERLEAFDRSGLFEEPVLKEYLWSRTLSAEDYVKLCCTYSDHIALPSEQRNELCEGIIEAINTHGGTIERLYQTRLYLSRKKAC